MPAIEPNQTTIDNSHRTIVATTATPVPVDWDLVSAAPVNVLLIGDSVTTRALVDTIRPHLREPLVILDCHEAFDLPSAHSCGTVILSDVDALVLADQQRVNAWLVEADARPRLITTSRVSLIPLIEAGMFVESLYYRLNTLCIDQQLPGATVQ